MSYKGHTSLTCPALGLMDDADTSLAFPSIWNCCYRSRPIASPNIKYQEEFCLNVDHYECPFFLSEKPLPLPGHIRAPRPGIIKRNKKTIWRTLFFVLIVLVLLVALAWGIWGQGIFPPFSMGIATAAASAIILPTSSDVPSAAVTASLLPPSTRPVAVQTGTAAVPLSMHQLEAPIGTDQKFLIHRVLEGENLDQYAPKYSTSVEAIVAVNHELTPPVWVGTLVVIPIGFTDVSDLPGFETHMITDTGMTVELLAQEFNVDPLDLKYYNSIRTGEILLIGDWFLIPHKK